MAVLIDLVDDAAIPGAQSGIVARGGDELDPRSDGDPCSDPSREKPGTLRVHTSHIGCGGPGL